MVQPTRTHRTTEYDTHLTHTATTVLTPSAPFHFNGTFFKPSHFPVPHRRHRPGRYHQALRLGDSVYGVRLTDVGQAASPRVELTVYGAEPIGEDVLGAVSAELAVRYDLAADLTGFLAIADRDEVLRPAVLRWRGARLGSGYSLYEFLVVTTVLQNTTVRRSTDMLAALFRRYGTPIVFDDTPLIAFWDPAALAVDGAEEELRALRVGYRARTLHRVAISQVRGDIDEGVLRTLSRDEARAALLRIYGVGPASVWYLLFEQLHHYDAIETISPWEQKIFSRLLFDQELVEPERILREARARWGGWAMLAAHYLFEDLFWRHRQEPIEWLAALIRL